MTAPGNYCTRYMCVHQAPFAQRKYFMRNKKLILAVAAASMVYGSAAFAAEGPASPTTAGPFGSGKILFTGTIINAPCDISSEDSQITVPFGQISQKHFKNAHDVYGQQPVTIHLKNCDLPVSGGGETGAPSKVTVGFNADNSSVDTTDKGWNNMGSATGVVIQLLDGSRNVIEPATGTIADVPLSSDTNINFYAQLEAISGTVTPGDINASLTYTLTYK